MVKCCAYDGCDRTIGDRFEYCYTHYATVKGLPIDQPGTRPPARPATITTTARENPKTGTPFGGRPWHDDPIVDALLKINSNLGRIAKLLEDENLTPDKDENTPDDDTPPIVDTFP